MTFAVKQKGKMMSWGIAETAPEIEKIKSESADYLNGLNSCGVIDWDTYNYAFDLYMDLLMKAYEQGKKDTQPEQKKGKWIIKETAYGDIEAKCSCCEFETLVNQPGNGLHMINDLHFCSNCGAYMVGEVKND